MEVKRALAVWCALLLGAPAAPPALALPAPPAPPPALASGEVVGLAGTPHLWIADEAGVLHWAGDTRALEGRSVAWDRRQDVPLGQLLDLPRGEPWLSAGLLQDAGAIFLVKWEVDAPLPSLLRVRSIADLELFGVDGANYGRVVLDPPSWEERAGLPLAGLPVGELAPAVPPPPPPAPPPPPPTPAPPPPPPTPAPQPTAAPAPPPPAPAGPQAFADAFGGADGTPLEAHNRAWQIDGGGWQLNAGRARMGAPGLSGGATVDTGRPDHEVQATIILPTSTERYPSDWFAGLFARYTDSESNLRIRYLYQDNSPEVELWEIDAGRATLLDFVNLGPDALLPGSTHTLGVVVQGRRVVAYHDGVAVAEGTTGLTRGNRAGIGVSDNLPSGRPQWDDFRARALG